MVVLLGVTCRWGKGERGGGGERRGGVRGGGSESSEESGCEGCRGTRCEGVREIKERIPRRCLPHLQLHRHFHRKDVGINGRKNTFDRVSPHRIIYPLALFRCVRHRHLSVPCPPGDPP